MGAPPNGWFIMEHAIKIDDLRVPLFQETSISSVLMHLFYPFPSAKKNGRAFRKVSVVKLAAQVKWFTILAAVSVINSWWLLRSHISCYIYNLLMVY